MDIPENILSEASEKGFGQNGADPLILMAKKYGKALPDLIQKREKGERIAKIAESVKADNRAIKKEAGGWRKIKGQSSKPKNPKSPSPAEPQTTRDQNRVSHG